MNEALARSVVHLAGLLRTKGIDVGTGQVVVAVAGVRELTDPTRQELRGALRATLVCTPSAGRVFDELFDLVFPDGCQSRPPSIVPPAPVSMTPLRNELRDVLIAGARDHVPDLAERFVLQFGAVGVPGDQVRGWSSRDLLRRLRLEELVLEASSTRAALRSSQFTYQREVIRLEVADLAAVFVRELDAVVTRFSSNLKGIDRVASHMVDGGLDDITFLTAPPEEMARLTDAMRPIAREIRASLVRKRGPRRGPIDLRRSIRRSMATGGVPFTLVRRRRPQRRPELVMLCDLSNSVAGFSSFTLALVAALAAEFSRVRMFGFVNRVAEVPIQDIRSWQAMLSSGWREEALCGQHKSSDYGSVIEMFAKNHAACLTRNCSLLVLGDARTNNYDPRPRILEELSRRVAVVHWLNPEWRALWGTGDSAANTYRAVVPMHEVRTLRHLKAFVSHHLASGVHE